MTKTNKMRATGSLLAMLALWSLSGIALAHPGHDEAEAQPADVRNWTDSRGIFQMEASFVSACDGNVQLRKQDGKLVTLPVDQLAADDRHWIEHRQEEIRKLNEKSPPVRLLAFAKPSKPEAAAPPIAAAFEPFAQSKAVTYRWDDKYFYVESNGLPDHPMMIGIRAWQQQVPLPQKYTGDNAWQIPLHPVPAKNPAMLKGRFLRGAVALAVNGIPIFNPLNNRGDDAYLFGELDEYGGHCGRADDYHYHLAPVHLEKQVGNGHVVAYALDGYPIYGFAEPDGSTVGKLDGLGGHKDASGQYHYHATKTYPYLNGGFYGEVTEREGQVDPQPRAQPVRPALPPLRDAKILGFTSSKSNNYKLTYEINGRKGYVEYALADNGSVEFKYTDPQGNTTTETNEPGRRPGGGRGPGGRGPDDRRPPRPGENMRPGENPPPPDGRRPPPPPPPRPGEEPAPRNPGNGNSTDAAPPTRSDLPQLAVTSPAIKPNANFPAEFTCDGAGISPPVQWSGAPKGTKAYALSLWHIPGPGDVKSYWILYNIPADVASLPKNAKGVGKDGLNGKNRTGYDPMCSKGPGVKKYNITVYALSEELKPADGMNRAALLEAIKGITLAEGTLSYNFERKPKN